MTDTSIIHQFTGVGLSRVAFGKQGAFALYGTFSATIELQRLVSGFWQTIATFTGPTVETDEVSFNHGIPMYMRFECTSFTSGEAHIVLNSSEE